MKSTWRNHVIVCLFLGLLAFPLYFLDLKATGEKGGGNWITLDFRGLIFWTYLTLLAIHVVVSSIAVWSFPKVGALRIHLGSMVLSLILLVAGFIAYGKLLRYRTISSQQRTLMESQSPILAPKISTADVPFTLPTFSQSMLYFEPFTRHELKTTQLRIQTMPDHILRTLQRFPASMTLGSK